MTKNENPEMPEINRKLLNNKNHPLLTVTVTRKLLKNYKFVSKYHFGFKNTQNYFFTSFIASFTLITLANGV